MGASTSTTVGRDDHASNASVFVSLVEVTFRGLGVRVTNDHKIIWDNGVSLSTLVSQPPFPPGIHDDSALSLLNQWTASTQVDHKSSSTDWFAYRTVHVSMTLLAPSEAELYGAELRLITSLGNAVKLMGREHAVYCAIVRPDALQSPRPKHKTADFNVTSDDEFRSDYNSNASGTYGSPGFLNRSFAAADIAYTYVAGKPNDGFLEVIEISIVPSSEEEADRLRDSIRLVKSPDDCHSSIRRLVSRGNDGEESVIARDTISAWVPSELCAYIVHQNWVAFPEDTFAWESAAFVLDDLSTAVFKAIDPLNMPHDYRRRVYVRRVVLNQNGASFAHVRGTFQFTKTRVDGFPVSVKKPVLNQQDFDRITQFINRGGRTIIAEGPTAVPNYIHAGAGEEDDDDEDDDFTEEQDSGDSDDEENDFFSEEEEALRSELQQRPHRQRHTSMLLPKRVE